MAVYEVNVTSSEEAPSAAAAAQSHITNGN